MEIIRIKKGHEKRLYSGHKWVYSNELLELPKLEVGTIVEVKDSSNRSYGLAFYNYTSLVACRLLDTHSPVDLNFLKDRIEKALNHRKLVIPNENSYRLVFGESDFLPGLVVDKYEDYLAVQILSAGMELLKIDIIKALLEVLPNTKGIIAKNESNLRKLENLPTGEEILFGDVPDEILIHENLVKLSVSLLSGQKTGYFLDQKMNRKFLQSISQNKRVLDCFTNQGGFALNASLAGASESLGIDISADAIEKCKQNANLNNLDTQFEKADVFDFLEKQVADNKKWDIVVLDPPAFAKNRKSVPMAKHAYGKINKLAMKLLERGGILISSSCTQQIDEDTFLDVITREASKQKRDLRVIFRGGQSPCHPVLMSMPETHYLKFYVFEVN